MLLRHIIMLNQSVQHISISNITQQSHLTTSLISTMKIIKLVKKKHFFTWHLVIIQNITQILSLINSSTRYLSNASNDTRFGLSGPMLWPKRFRPKNTNNGSRTECTPPRLTAIRTDKMQNFLCFSSLEVFRTSDFDSVKTQTLRNYNLCNTLIISS